jgi:hypothetical protein
MFILAFKFKIYVKHKFLKKALLINEIIKFNIVLIGLISLSATFVPKEQTLVYTRKGIN